MAKIPTYEQQFTPDGKLTVQASPADMGMASAAALGVVGRNVSDDMFALNAKIQQQRKQAKNLDDERWASEQYENAKLSLAEYSSQPTVAHADDVAEKILGFTSSHLDSITPDSAPSPEAYRLFKESFTRFGMSRAGQAYEQGYKNKIDNAVVSFSDQIATAITAYNTDKNLHGLLDSSAQITATVSKTLGELDPFKAKALKEDLVTQSALVVMRDNPSAATTLVMRSTDIDEQTRTRLLSEIKTASRTRNSFQQYTFGLERQRQNEMAEISGKNVNRFTTAEYTAIYGEEQGQVEKAQDDLLIGIGAKAATIWNTVKALNPDEQQRVLSSIVDTSTRTPENIIERQGLEKMLAHKLQANIKLAETDSVGFLAANNPIVTAAGTDLNTAYAKLQANPNDENVRLEYSAKLKTFNDTLLMLQGPPPKGVEQTEAAKLYLNKPQSQWSLLSADEAKTQGDFLNSAKPNEFLTKTDEYMSRYVDDKHRQIAFNDLVTRGKLNQQYQFAWLNRDAWWINSYVSAIAAGKDISVSEKEFKDITDRVDAHPTFMSFTQALVGTENQNPNEYAGFREGVIQWAKVLTKTQGKSAKEAVNSAMQLVTNNLGFTKVNGRPLMIYKQRDGLPKYTDEEVDDIGRRLGFVSQFIPLKDVDTESFTALLHGMSEEAKLKALSDDLSSRMFWQIGPDGKSASAYVIDKSGLQAFQLRDKTQKPFVVRFNNLPTFKAEPVFGYSLPGSMPSVRMGVKGVVASDTIHPKYSGITPMNLQTRPQWLTTD